MVRDESQFAKSATSTCLSIQRRFKASKAGVRIKSSQRFTRWLYTWYGDPFIA